MVAPSSQRSGGIVVLQSIGLLLGLTWLAAMPPARGTMLLLPLGTDAAARLLPAALAGEARLIGTGPLPGSLVVSADLDRLTAPMRRAHVLILAAPAAGCAARTANG